MHFYIRILFRKQSFLKILKGKYCGMYQYTYCYTNIRYVRIYIDKEFKIMFVPSLVMEVVSSNPAERYTIQQFES